MLKPLKGSVVVPRVDEINLLSANTLSRKLLGGEFVQKVVLVLLSKVIKAVFEVRLNDLDCDLSHLSLFLKTLFLLAHAVISQSPQPKLTKKWLNVFFDCLKEVGMIEMEDLFDKITN